MKKTRIHLIAAARPNFMKVAPLYRALGSCDWCQVVLIHTGQHYQPNMSDTFFKDLGLPSPDYNLGIGGGSHAQQVGRLMMVYEGLCDTARPDMTIVVGDVNATLSVALTAAKMSIPVGHVEAGLRSFDRSMPEEINRIVTDSVSDIFFTPSSDADENLIREGVQKNRIKMVGNVMIDSYCLLENKIKNTPTPLVDEIERYAVVTLHRPSNVDDKDRLGGIVSCLRQISSDISLLAPLHPRTRKNLEKFGFWEEFSSIPNVFVTNPLGYVEFMAYVRNATFVLTDSGGIQEETTYLKIPCFTLRDNTERPVTITQGTNSLVNLQNIIQHIDSCLLNGTTNSKCPALWDGKSAQRICDILETELKG